MKSLLKLAFSGVALLTSLPYAHAASFDCSKAATHIERTICASPRLSALDIEVDALYRHQLNRTPDAGGARDEVRSNQRAWLREARNACPSERCLEMAYMQRVTALKEGKALYDDAKANAEQEEKNPPPGPEVKQAAAKAPAPVPVPSPQGRSASLSTSSSVPARSRMDAGTICTNASVFAFERLETWIAIGIEQALLTGNLDRINKHKLNTDNLILTGRMKEMALQWQDSPELMKVWGGMAIAIDNDVRMWTKKYRNGGSNPTLWKQDVHRMCMTFLAQQPRGKGQ